MLYTDGIGDYDNQFVSHFVDGRVSAEVVQWLTEMTTYGKLLDLMVKIGYTTGVYDLFHIGHLNILRNAKLACDYLIVGVTTDELAINSKGTTPVISFAERLAIVESIKYVDMVVPQTSYDKIEAWNNLHFNVMFVGDDWKGSEKWVNLEKELDSKGVSIVYFPYTVQTSSTKLRKVLELMYSQAST